jgi:putative copper export protein
MRARLVTTALVALGLLLATAAPVLAVGTDDGEGWVGEANDKIITFMSLGVIAFFPLVALLLTLLQSALERRKERRKAAASRRTAGW